jgi:hypothetical protein
LIIAAKKRKNKLFLGLANFYCRLVLGLFHIPRDLSQITKGGGKEKFVWGLSQHKVFDDMKKHLCSTPVISLPDMQHPFEIETNDLEYVVDAIITQQIHPVTYHNETLSYAISNYPAYNKEMYSIVQACF